MTSLRERRRQMLRDEIIEATQSLIAEKGYSAMSMDELAARVGISKPTLYNQFATKEGLVVEVTRRVLRHLLVMAEEQEPDQSALDQLCHILHTVVVLQVEKQRQAMAQIWMPELLTIVRDHPETFALIQRLDEQVIRLVQTAMAQGAINTTLDPASVVRTFFGLICANGIGKESKALVTDPEVAADTVTTIFRKGVAA